MPDINMEIKTLDTIAFSDLVTCFLKTFENYFVKMPTDLDYYQKRWRMAGMYLNLSYGMFYKGKLVGFVIHAIDEREGNLIAYNTGTGVLPEYRGRHIVNSIYQFAFPELRKNGVTKCQLEVIKENKRALNVYKAIGFKTTRNYKCFSGDIMLGNEITDFELKKVDKSYFDWNSLHQNTYSWDNHFRSIQKGEFDYYVVLKDGNQEAYFVVDPKNGNLPQFDILMGTPNNWNRLFAAIKSISNNVNIKNVDQSLTEKINFLNEIHLKNSVDQYEMELDL